jgi:hypothetical protein
MNAASVANAKKRIKIIFQMKSLLCSLFSKQFVWGKTSIFKMHQLETWGQAPAIACRNLFHVIWCGSPTVKHNEQTSAFIY